MICDIEFLYSFREATSERCPVHKHSPHDMQRKISLDTKLAQRLTRIYMNKCPVIVGSIFSILGCR